MAVQRLIIKAFSDEKLKRSAGSYTVRVNPEKYSQSLQINYSDRPAVGSMNTALRFANMPPAKISFELLFDVTGAIPGSAKDLTTEINAFLKVVYNYDGAIHEPHYLRLVWGKLNFTARLTSLEMQYTLFSPSGAPLRARATASFSNFVDPATIAKDEDKQSSDLTHQRVVKQGDTLIGLAREVYGDPRMYVKVARVNGLSSTRRLAVGTRLRFPPMR